MTRFFAKAEFKKVHRVPVRRFRCPTKVWSGKGLCRGEGYDTTACWVKADESRVRIDRENLIFSKLQTKMARCFGGGSPTSAGRFSGFKTLKSSFCCCFETKSCYITWADLDFSEDSCLSASPSQVLGLYVCATTEHILHLFY